MLRKYFTKPRYIVILPDKDKRTPYIPIAFNYQEYITSREQCHFSKADNNVL